MLITSSASTYSTSLNLLDKRASSLGAFPSDGFVEVNSPWGSYVYEKISLLAAIYKLKIEGSVGVSVEISNLETYSQVELQATTDCPAVIKLPAGPYVFRVTCSATPGKYPITRISFERLSFLDIWTLIILRLTRGLAAGASLFKLLDLARKRLFQRSPFGINLQNENQRSLGVITAQALARKNQLDACDNINQRIQNLRTRPVFFIKNRCGLQISQEQLAGQVYRNFHCDEKQKYDFTVILEVEDQLTLDSLLLFAEAICSNEKVDLIISDKWCGDFLTQNIAWDPILYSNGHFPTPFAHRNGTDPEALMSFNTNRTKCMILPAPTATGRTFTVQQDVMAIEKSPCSIIIPTRDRADLLRACLESLFQHTQWPHEVIIIDNGSIENETFILLKKYTDLGARVIRADIPFNFSKLCNIGVSEAHCEYVTFLNNDVLLTDHLWLDHLMRYAQHPHVGAVGARLLYDDMSLQHGGVALGLNELAGHLWRGLSSKEQGHIPQLSHASLRSAVTAACLCVSKEKFLTVEGFDEKEFPVTFNDIDLCLKLAENGWHTVYAADAVAYHKEGESRGNDHHGAKRQRRQFELDKFKKKWKLKINSDPYISINQSLSTESHTYR